MMIFVIYEVPLTVGVVYAAADIFKTIDIAIMTWRRDYKRYVPSYEKERLNDKILGYQPIGPISLAAKWFTLRKFENRKSI